MSQKAWTRFECIARSKGADPALIHGATRLSFNALHTTACAWANQLDIAPGSRVIVSGENGLALAAAILGLWCRGAIPVLVDKDAPRHHLDHICSLTGALAILIDAGRDLLDLAVPAIHIEMPELGVSNVPALSQTANEPASILFTSGSTGLPKGVVQSAATLIDGAERVAAHAGYRPDDTILCAIPFAFDYGWGQLLSTLFCGIPLVLPEPCNAFGLCDALRVHRPSILAGVPALFADLLSGLSPIRETNRASIRMITNTGSKIPGPVFATLTDLFPDAEVSLNYGLTETYRTASLPTALARKHSDSVGYSIPGVDLAVIRPDGTPCAAEEEGEIIHRGRGLFLGYWGEIERTAQTLRPDPLWPHVGVSAPNVAYTGDLGRIDAAGLLYIHGRRDRQMKSMGVRVAPDEIEALLYDSGLVVEAAVTARLHDTLGEMIVAVVVLRFAEDAAASVKSLKQYARGTMSPYMQPRAYHIVPCLPRTPSGKVDYPALTRLACAEI